jgi:DNA polymerase IV
VTRWVLHVDLDQFIAAVEVLRRPELRGRPVVVGGDGDPAKRGVVATASYEARACGVHSGLPLRTAVRRCPDAVFLPVDKPAYEAASATVMAALRGLAAGGSGGVVPPAASTGAVVEVMGWDEAFIAVDTSDPRAVARAVQETVSRAASLSCTVGIGENKLQAKLATGFGKPAGVFVITGQNWFDVLGGQPVQALWGVGSRTARRLAALGVTTVSELAAVEPAALVPHFGPAIGPWLVQTARGLSPSQVTDEPYLARSRGRETTFQQDIDDWEQVTAEIVRLAALVAHDVAEEGRPAARVVVKVRYVPFFTRTHGVSLPEPTGEPAEIERSALEALEWFTGRRAVRLLGVRAEFPAEAGEAAGR